VGGCVELYRWPQWLPAEDALTTCGVVRRFNDSRNDRLPHDMLKDAEDD
jgi:hypothetical protein